MLPGGQIKDMVFHHDSASSHTSKQTLAYMRKQFKNFVTPQEWIPKSPDAAPVVLLSGGSLNDAGRSEKSTLWQALNEDREKNGESWSKTLVSWPKRGRLIYNLHEPQI